MARLSPRDAALPQVVTTCEMVKRGIGVHHGGLLVSSSVHGIYILFHRFVDAIQCLTT
jgi:hypothetical protein